MNKAPFLICLLSVSFLASNAYSGAGDKGKLYGIVDIGASEAAITLQSEYNAPIDKVIAKSKKSQFSAALDVGVGYYLFDSFRTDLSIYYSPAKKFKFKQTFNNPTTNDVVVLLNDGTLGLLAEPSTSTSVSSKTQGLFWNVAYELATTWKVVPYISAGVGYVQNDIKSGQVSGAIFPKKKDTYMAYQFGGGVQYNIDYGMDFLVGYKYFKSNKKELVLKGDTIMQVVSTGALKSITETFRIKSDPVHSGYLGLKLTF
jgi:opacity protein-like surface antigen